MSECERLDFCAETLPILISNIVSNMLVVDFLRHADKSQRNLISKGGTWNQADTPHFEIDTDWKESEDKPMTQQERIKFNELVGIIDRLADRITKLEQPMIYNYIDKNMPEWARPTVQKLVGQGILKGDENGLHLTDSDLR